MSRNELAVFLKEHLVPAKLYSLNGNHTNRICLEKSKQGWEVYFSDQKQKIGLLKFSSESDACARMKTEILKIMQSLYGLSWANMPV